MYGNPYFNQNNRFQPIEPINNLNNNPYMAPMQVTQNNNTALLGRSVDSIDVVKAMDIPLDGSVSYFPLLDGSAIVTKKLTSDGTSRMVIYKPVEQNKKETIKYATLDEVEDLLGDLNIEDLKDLKEDIKALKKQFKEFKDNLKTKKED